MGEEPFARWQPEYAKHGVALFPVAVTTTGKRPLVCRYLKTTPKSSEQFRLKFPAADAFGFACGPRNRITIVDLDSTDEAIIEEGRRLFGDSPLLWRTGGGKFAMPFRYNGERRRIRPIPALPIDLLGGGFAVAPPSAGAVRPYEIIAGTLADLARLPVARIPVEVTKPSGGVTDTPPDAISQGERDRAIWRYAMQVAPRCGSVEELIAMARTYNLEHCRPPQDDDLVVHAAESVWRYEERGLNFVGGRCVVVSHAEIEDLAARSPDALALLFQLRRRHWEKDEFVLANAMAPSLGWTLRRFKDAQRLLTEGRYIVCVSPGGRTTRDPPRYAWPKRRCAKSLTNKSTYTLSSLSSAPLLLPS
jgi:hypothetical protein